MPHPPFEVRPADTNEVIFRVVDRRNPGPAQFRSDEEDGRTDALLRTQNVAIYRGFSARNTLIQATKLARLLDKQWVAEVALDADEGDCVAHTLTSRGHRTIWAEAESVSQRILAIHAVDD
jgi:hypothetical protein